MSCNETFEENSLEHSHQWENWPNKLRLTNYAMLVLPIDHGCGKCGKTPEEMLQDFEAYKRARGS